MPDMPDVCELKDAGCEALDAYLDRVRHLPPPPTLMIQLINLFRQPDADLDEIVELLKRDPALAAEVLRRCNHTFMDKNEEAARDINEAVFCLGFHEVYQITVSLFSMRLLSIEKDVPKFPAEQLRRHSSITAIAAGELALELNLSEGIAFTSGLLHDIGKLALALAEGEVYSNLFRECEKNASSLSAAEKERFGFNHSEVGGRLLQRWGVPQEIVLPALGHNDPAQPGEMQTYVAAINLASQLANRVEQKTVTGQFSALIGVKETMELLNLDDKQMLQWETAVRKKAREFSVMMKA
jgi:putative nucleotidyltransferase with HDIG domain